MVKTIYTKQKEMGDEEVNIKLITAGKKKVLIERFSILLSDLKLVYFA